MSFVRAVLSVASIFLGLSAAVAQQPAITSPSAPKLPVCSPSMIAGRWQAVFTASWVSPGYFSCAISVSPNGSLTASNCLPGGYSFSQLPSGTLTIDRTCHVTGTMTYSVCINGCAFPSTSFQILPSLWRSIDGSRLSGYYNVVSGASNVCSGEGPCALILPFEMIASP
jgi:hypothetical protein